MTSPRVVLYATSTCPYCEAARAVLSRCGEPFIERDPTADPEILRELLVAATRAIVPTVVVGERVLVGFDEERLVEMLHEPPLEPEPEDEFSLDELLDEEEDEVGGDG
jgi:glutaredoxin 3